MIKTLADSDRESADYDHGFEGFHFKLSGDKNHTDVTNHSNDSLIMDDDD